jgi:tetratricopeptide (TPR) repeat protein
MNPAHEQANLNLANIWRFRKNFKLAGGYYEQALKANTRLAEAHLGMADCIFNEGNIDEATRAYAFIVTNFPGEYTGYLGLARILIHNAQYKEARVAILKAREIVPQNSQIYEMLGILSYSQKDNKGAIDNFKRAVMLDSNNLTAYQSLINILIDEKKLEEALLQIKNCLSKFPSNPRLYYLAGIIYSGFKNDALALKNLLESYKLDNNNIEVILAIAIIHEKNYKYRDSLDKYREALLIAEENKDMRYINNIHERIDMLEKKIEKYPEDK